MQNSWWVYVIRCSDSSLYTGITKDIARRITEHNTSHIGAKYTKSRRPVMLVWSKKIGDRATASRQEIRIKKLPRKKKEALISSGIS